MGRYLDEERQWASPPKEPWRWEGDADKVRRTTRDVCVRGNHIKDINRVTIFDDWACPAGPAVAIAYKEARNYRNVGLNLKFTFCFPSSDRVIDQRKRQIFTRLTRSRNSVAPIVNPETHNDFEYVRRGLSRALSAWLLELGSWLGCRPGRRTFRNPRWTRHQTSGSAWDPEMANLAFCPRSLTTTSTQSSSSNTNFHCFFACLNGISRLESQSSPLSPSRSRSFLDVMLSGFLFLLVSSLSRPHLKTEMYLF